MGFEIVFQQTSSSHARSDDVLVPRPLAAMGFAIQASAFLCSASSADARMSFGHGLAGVCQVARGTSPRPWRKAMWLNCPWIPSYVQPPCLANVPAVSGLQEVSGGGKSE